MEPSSDDIKEVYAQFGLAYYLGEVLHRGLCHLYLGLRSPEEGRTQPRIEELMREAYAETFGGIFNKVRYALQDELAATLGKAVERRNYLAHQFWFEQVHMLSSAEGAHALVVQLAESTAEFERINSEVERLTRADLYRLGITGDTLEGMLAEASQEPMEPLPTQRRLKKEELVVAVYDVPITGGGMTLVFETDDHALWQLCDVGLGWSRYQTVSSEWHQAEPFQDILPARVTPRPKTTAAWQYDIPFGPETTLVVRLAENKRNFIYRLKRKDRARGEALRPS